MGKIADMEKYVINLNNHIKVMERNTKKISAPLRKALRHRISVLKPIVEELYELLDLVDEP